MHKKFYLCRMSFLRYDSEHFLLFLSEQRVENYHPDTNMSESDGDSQAVTAYSYEGSEIDGSTKIEAKSASYRAVSYTHLTLPTKSDECRSRWSPYH